MYYSSRMRTIPIAAMATAALFAITPSAAASASGGSALANSVTKVDEKTIDGGELVRCTSADTVTLEVLFSQTVSGPNDPGSTGKTKAKVACATDPEQQTIRVPITRDGPVIAGRMAAIATTMYNSAGKEIHSDSALQEIQEPHRPSP